MNALLVYPEMPDTFYGLRHMVRVVGKKAAYPPLGLLTVAAMLPGEWNLRLVDLNVRALTQKDLDWGDFVFLSAMNVQEESVRQVIDRCGQADVPIVAGGPLFTHEHARFPGVAHFVLNEAEITLPRFLQDLENGDPSPVYTCEEFADITETPLPALELIDMSDYLYAIVQYSRGCPYMCDFCDVTTLYGRRPRIKPFEQIERELEAVMAAGGSNAVLFADDNLIGNKRSLKNDLLPKLIEWYGRRRPPFSFATQLTINLADDPKLMQLLLEAGFRWIFVGIETPEEESLLSSRKTQNLRRNLLENIEILQTSGFYVAGGFIVGFDTDTDEVFDRQIRFIQDSGIPLPIVNILKAPPGTELFERMKREGRLIRDFAFSEGETNISTVMPAEQLFPGFERLIRHIHSPAGSFERMTRFMSRYNYPKTKTPVRVPFRWGNVLTAFRVIWLLGIVDPARLYFWRLLASAIRINHKFLDTAFLFAALAHQMDRSSQHIVSSLPRFDRQAAISSGTSGA